MSRPAGFKHTEATKQKMREHAVGFHRKHSEEEKAKTSQAMKEWHRTHKHPRKGKRVSAATRMKMSLARQGSNNANWKGGLTELVKGIRRSPEFLQWRKAVLERDNYTCQDCRATENLEAHHIQSILDCPQDIFVVENGLTLCHECHRKHTWWQKLRPKRRETKSKKRI